MRVQPRPKIVKAQRLITDDAGSYQIKPYSFRLDQVVSITQDYKYIPNMDPEQRCVLLTDNELVTVLVNYDDLHKVWVRAVNDSQIIIFTNDN